MESSNNELALPIILTAIVVFVYLGCLFYIIKCKDDNTLKQKKRWLEQLPSMVSTVGVLFTFLGITIGLMDFEPDNVSESIPNLLKGLRTAFFTSLAGMLCSMLLSRQVNSAFDEAEEGDNSDSFQAAKFIVNSLQKSFSQNNSDQKKQIELFETMASSLNQINETVASLSDNMLSMAQKQDAIKKVLSTQNDKFDEQKVLCESQIATMKEIKVIAARDLAFSDENNKNIDTIKQAIAKSDISDKISILTDKLHAEVAEIENAMDKTNSLLSEKFSEFTELLKKSNTEALVEVMKRVTEEFQKQMGHLINKLVQENFDQLNKSVERLNDWQVENKDMIESLTKQYKQMATDFESTSDTLSKVGSDTQLLVSDGSKLQQIVFALNKVMVDDTKFIEISSKLADNADLSKKNMEEFHESTQKLNEWVKKQRNFVESVQLLIEKLDAISKINDYSDVFWKETKSGMNEAIGIVKSGVESLNGQIENLDEHFYERLNATLSELDTCIQAMIKGR